MSGLKKLLSLLLVGLMVLTVLPVNAFAQSEIIGSGSVEFTLNLEAGLTYFGFPISVEKPISEILPGVTVYRFDGTRWVAANNELPMPFSVYKVGLNTSVSVVLKGEEFKDASLTIPADTLTYFSLPETKPISVRDLFGDAVTYLKAIGKNGSLTDVPVTGQIEPGKAYIVKVSRSITLTAKDEAPEISEVKFNDNAVTNGGTVSLVVKEGETPKGTVTFKVSDDKGISSVNVNGVDVSAVSGEYSRELTLSVGSNNVQIEAVDTANQKTTYSFTVEVTVDKKPEISEVKFNDNAVTNGGTVSLVVKEGETPKGTVTFKVSDDKGISSVNVNGVDVSAVSGEYSRELTLSVGSNNVQIEAVDTANQKTTYSFTVEVTVDKKPEISEVKFNDNAVTNGGTVSLVVKEGETPKGTVTFKVSDDKGISSVNVNGVDVSAVSGEYSRELTLSVGSNNVQIEAVDTANQKTTYSFTVEVTVDKKPEISEVKFNDNAVTNGGTVSLVVKEGETPKGTVTFKVSDDNLHVVTVNGERVDPEDGVYSYEVTFDHGETEVSIIAVDKLDQLSTYSFTVKVTEDKAPVISDVKFNDNAVANGETVPLVVKEGETPKGTVTFKVSDDNLHVVTVNGERVDPEDGLYSYELTFELGETEVSIIAVDKLDQLSTYSFTVKVTEDKAPVISDVAFNGTAVTGTVSLEVKEGETATGLLTFKVTDEDLAKVTVNGEKIDPEDGFYSYELSDLAAGPHEVVIDATDKAGQLTTYSFTIVVTENAKPVISDVALRVGSLTISATNGGEYTVTVPELAATGVLTFVATDEDVNSVTVKVNGDELTAENDGSYVITFDTATTYSIEITAVDAAEQSTSFAFSVRVALDKVPEISNVVLEIANTTTTIQAGESYPFTLLEDEIASGATLTFSATDDIGLKEVTVNDNLVPKINGHYLWASDLAEGTFAITIKAVDSSNQEATFAFTILISKDAAPTISQAELTVTTSTGVKNVAMTGTIAVVSISATLNLSISDDVALSNVTVKLNGLYVSTPTIAGTSTVLALPVTLQPGLNTATVTVTDNKGQSKTSTYAFNVTVNQLPVIGNISLKVGAKELASIENGGTYTLGFTGTSLPGSGTLTFTATDPEDSLRTLTVWVNGEIVWARSYLGATTSANPTFEIPLSNGSNTIKIEGKDGASQVSSVQFTVSIVPDTPPEIQGVTLEYLVQQGVLTSTTLTTGTVTATLSSETVSVAVDAVDQVGTIATVQVVVDGTTKTLTGTHAPYEGTITLGTGTYNIKVIVTDDAEQTASTEFNFVVTSIDKLPQISAVDFELGGKHYGPGTTGTTIDITAREDYLSVATLTFSATDDHALQTVEVNDSTLAVTASGFYTATVGPLHEGSNIIKIHVVDNTEQPNDFVFYVDITIDTKPEITDVVVEYAGSNGQSVSKSVADNETLTATLSSTSATISVTATDSVGSVSNIVVKVNGSEQVNVSTPTLTKQITLNTGTNTIEVVVTDDAQQTVTRTFTFIVNLDKLPEISSVKLDIAHQGKDNSATSINLVNGGTSTINIASNSLPVSATLTFDASDDKGMVVVSATVVTASGAEPIYSGTQYGGTLHAQPVFRLVDGANQIMITAKDSIGQTYDFAYTVNVQKNNVPVIKNVQLKLGSKSYNVNNGATETYYSASDVKATLTLKISDENPAGLVVSATLDNVAIVPNFVGDTYVFTPTLTTNATHTIVVTATDDYGQTDTFTLYVVIKVDNPPEISNAKLQLTGTTITATNGGAYTATAASAPITGTLTFNVADDLGVESVTLKVNDATTNYTVTGSSYSAVVTLKAGSNAVKISSKDSGGNEKTLTFTATLDIPPVIKDVQVKVDNSATLNLANGDIKNLGLGELDSTGTITFTIDNLEDATVTVKVNGSVTQTTSVGSIYTATFATTSTITSYVIYITAVDEQGMTSFTATIVTATDTQPPTVKDVVLQVGKSTIPLTDGTSTTVTLAVPADATVTFIATDNIGIAAVEFYGKVLNISPNNQYNATLQLPAGETVVKIIATDLAGNPTTFSATVVVVKDNKPTVKTATLTVMASTGKKDITDITGTINVVSSSATLTFTAADDIALAGAKVIVNGNLVFDGSLKGTETSTSVAITLKTGTTNTVTITVTDSAGQSETRTYSFDVVVDALPAISATLQTNQGNIPLSNGTSTIIANLPDQGTLVFTISDDGKVSNFKVDVNGVVLTGNPGSKSVSYSLPVSINSEGTYVINITATDDIGQVSTFTATVSRNKAPTISDVTLQLTGIGAITQNATLVVTASTLNGTITFKAEDSDGTVTPTPVVTIKRDGSTVATITSTPAGSNSYTATYTFVPGTYVIDIKAIDDLGTATSYKLNLTIERDTATPEISNVQLETDVLTLPVDSGYIVKISQSFLASGATVTFSVAEAHLDKVTVKVGSVAEEEITSTTGVYQYRLPATLPAGETPVTITASDVVGHVATFSFTLQVQAPTITVNYGNDVIDSATTIDPVKTASLNLLLMVDSAGTVEVTIDNGTSTTNEVAVGSTWEIPLKELLREDGTYSITIKATDVAGNEATVTFTLVVDNEKPTLLSLKAIDTVGNEVTAVNGELQWEVGQAVATIEAVVSEPVEIVDGSTAVVYINIPGGSWSRYGTFAVDSDDPTKIIITPDPSNATAALTGTFTFKVDAGVVKDLAGNTNDEITITLVVEDNVVPEITEVKLGGETVDNDGTATLNFTDVAGTTLSFAATDNVGVTSVIVTVDDTELVPVNEEYTLSELAVGEHNIVITVKDAAGNENTFSFTLVVVE